MGSSRTGARTCVSCIGRHILNHCATREAPRKLFFFKNGYVAFFILQLCVRKIKEGKEGRKNGEIELEEENLYSAFKLEGLASSKHVFGMRPMNLVNLVD